MLNNACARYIEVTVAPAHDTVRIRSGALRWDQTNFVSKNKCVLGAVMCFLSPAVEQENITALSQSGCAGCVAWDTPQGDA